MKSRFESGAVRHGPRPPIEEKLKMLGLGWEGVEKVEDRDEEQLEGQKQLGPGKGADAADVGSEAGAYKKPEGDEWGQRGKEEPGEEGKLRLAVCLCFDGGQGTIGTVKVRTQGGGGNGFMGTEI